MPLTHIRDTFIQARQQIITHNSFEGLDLFISGCKLLTQEPADFIFNNEVCLDIIRLLIEFRNIFLSFRHNEDNNTLVPVDPTVKIILADPLVDDSEDFIFYPNVIWYNPLLYLYFRKKGTSHDFLILQYQKAYHALQALALAAYPFDTPVEKEALRTLHTALRNLLQRDPHNPYLAEFVFETGKRVLSFEDTQETKINKARLLYIIAEGFSKRSQAFIHPLQLETFSRKALHAYHAACMLWQSCGVVNLVAEDRQKYLDSIFRFLFHRKNMPMNIMQDIANPALKAFIFSIIEDAKYLVSLQPTLLDECFSFIKQLERLGKKLLTNDQHKELALYFWENGLAIADIINNNTQLCQRQPANTENTKNHIDNVIYTIRLMMRIAHVYMGLQQNNNEALEKARHYYLTAKARFESLRFCFEPNFTSEQKNLVEAKYLRCQERLNEIGNILQQKNANAPTGLASYVARSLTTVLRSATHSQPSANALEPALTELKQARP